MHQQLITKRLFYNKWLYKVECNSQDSNRGRNRKSNLAFWATVKRFIPADVKTRREHSHYSVFTNDEALVKLLTKEFNHWLVAVTAPENDEQKKFLLDNGHKKVLCNKLPYDKYQYKIFFKSVMKIETKAKFLEWTGKYADKFKISPTTTRWLSGSRGWTQDPFMLVEDSKMLSMTLLYLGDHVKKIQEHILKDSINT